jgi:hypothetical protein
MKILCELIIERDGRIVYRGLSKSFIQNFAKILYAILGSPGNIPLGSGGVISSASVLKPDGSSADVWGERYDTNIATKAGGVALATYAADNDDSYGIIVGSSSQSVSPTDYNLISKIPHGTGAGQLDYEAHSVVSSYTSSSSYVEISRIFLNKSGGDVVVREVGLLGRNYWKDTAAVRNDVKFLIARDVLPTPITVKNLGNLLIRYRISLAI